MFPPALPPATVFVRVPPNAVLFGIPKFAWFIMLKNSARNCRLPCSPRNPSLVSLIKEKSQSVSPGIRKTSRGVLPCRPSGPSPNISALNQWLGSPVMTVFGSYGMKLYVHELVMGGVVVVVVQPGAGFELVVT